MSIKAILFDKDGTLLDYHATWTGINLRAALTAASGDTVLVKRLLTVADADPETGRAHPGGCLRQATPAKSRMRGSMPA